MPLMSRIPERYVLRTFRGGPEVQCDTYRDALARAVSSARRGSVDVFYAEENGGFALVARHRCA
jgi:hypothetical protein